MCMFGIIYHWNWKKRKTDKNNIFNFCYRSLYNLALNDVKYIWCTQTIVVIVDCYPLYIHLWMQRVFLLIDLKEFNPLQASNIHNDDSQLSYNVQLWNRNCAIHKLRVHSAFIYCQSKIQTCMYYVVTVAGKKFRIACSEYYYGKIVLTLVYDGVECFNMDF